MGFSDALISRCLPEDFLNKYIKINYEYNPDKAVQILESLGFKKGENCIWVTPNGTKLSFVMTGFGYGDRVADAQVIVGNLKKIGIEVKYVATDPGVAGEVLTGRRRIRADLFMRWWWSPYPPIPLSWYRWYFFSLRTQRSIRHLSQLSPQEFEVP